MTTGEIITAILNKRTDDIIDFWATYSRLTGRDKRLVDAALDEAEGQL
jgi:hypothetical protein